MSEKEARKQKIIEIANQLFERNGYAETTMTEIATASGVSRRTLFRIFPNKDDLLVISRGETSLNDWFEQQPDDIGFIDLLNKLLKEQIGVGGTSLHETYRHWFQTLNTEADTRSAILQQVLKGMPIIVDLLAKRYPDIDKQEIWVVTGSLVGSTIAAWSQVSIDNQLDPLNQINENFDLMVKKLK